MANIHDADPVANSAIRNADSFNFLTSLGANATTDNPAASKFAKFSLEALSEHINGPSVTVRASGVDATDDTQMTNAVSLINSAGKGTIYIDGMVRLTSTHTITVNCQVIGLGAHSGFDSDISVQLNIGNVANYVSLAGTALNSNISQFDTEFDATGLGISSGDFGLLVSNGDNIDVPPSGGGGNQYPAQLVHVVHLEGNTARTHGAIYDNYTHSSKKWVPITMVNGVKISNLILKNNTTPTDATDVNSIRLVAVNGFEIDNVRKSYSTGGGGTIRLDYCSRGVIKNCKFDLIDNNDFENHIELNCVNGVIIAKNHFSTARHAVTTVGAKSSGLDRWGTPCNIVVVGNTIDWSEMGDNTGQSAIDSHAEGYAFSVIGNHFSLGHKAIGVNAECRRVTVTGNVFWGGDNAKGVLVAEGPDCTISHNVFNACQTHIDVNPDTERTRMFSNHHYRGTIPILMEGENGKLINSYFEEWLSGVSGAVRLKAGTSGNEIDNCWLDKSPSSALSIDAAGLTSSDVKIQFNSRMRGYGAGSMGLANDTGGLNAAYAADNFTD